MDANEMPSWFIDIQRVKQESKYARIPLELVVSNGEISKVIGQRVSQVRFQSHPQDQHAARLWAVDILNTLDSDGTTTFSIIHKGNTIKQINTFHTVEYNYAPGSKQ